MSVEVEGGVEDVATVDVANIPNNIGWQHRHHSGHDHFTVSRHDAQYRDEPGKLLALPGTHEGAFGVR